MKNWWFTEHELEEGIVWWSWRLLQDGTVQKQSAEFTSYGSAVRDAIVNGFQPAQDPWTIETKTLLARYRNGRSAIERKIDNKPPDSPRRRDRTRGRTS